MFQNLCVSSNRYEYGDGYGKGNLAYYRQFYLMFSDLEFLHARVQNLEWSHIKRVLPVTNADVRANGILKMLPTICGVDRWGAGI